jgi:hypothetical protein
MLMNRNFLQYLGLGLATPTLLLFMNVNFVYAKPAQEFNSILPDLTRLARQGWSIRLPANLRLIDRPGQVYPQLKFDPGEVWIFLNSMPDCQARACQGTNIVISRKRDEFTARKLTAPAMTREQQLRVINIYRRSFETWSSSDKRMLIEADGAVLDRKEITLGNGIYGISVLINGRRGIGAENGIVAWQQDKMYYRVSGGANLTDLVGIAQSMVKESPLQ